MVHNPEHILAGAQTPPTQPPGLTISAGAEPLSQQPGVFGGKLLPERGLLANVLLAGLLGLGAGARAQNPLEAVAAGGFAPFQFKLQQRQREEQEEERAARLANLRGQTEARAASELRQEDLLEMAKVDAAAKVIQRERDAQTFPLKIRALEAGITRDVAATLKSRGYTESSVEEFDEAERKGLPAITQILEDKIRFFTIDDPLKILPAYTIPVKGFPPLKVASGPAGVQDRLLAAELAKSHARFQATIQSDTALRAEALQLKFQELMELSDGDPTRFRQMLEAGQRDGSIPFNQAKQLQSFLSLSISNKLATKKSGVRLGEGTTPQALLGATALPIEKPTEEQLNDPKFKGTLRSDNQGNFTLDLDVPLATPGDVEEALLFLAKRGLQLRSPAAGEGLPPAPSPTPTTPPATIPTAPKEDAEAKRSKAAAENLEKLLDLLDKLGIRKRKLQ
jgi:hypothetical protein